METSAVFSAATDSMVMAAGLAAVRFTVPLLVWETNYSVWRCVNHPVTYKIVVWLFYRLVAVRKKNIKHTVCI